MTRGAFAPATQRRDWPASLVKLCLDPSEVQCTPGPGTIWLLGNAGASWLHTAG